jgi:hypothetical protein
MFTTTSRLLRSLLLVLSSTTITQCQDRLGHGSRGTDWWMRWVWEQRMTKGNDESLELKYGSSQWPNQYINLDQFVLECYTISYNLILAGLSQAGSRTPHSNIHKFIVSIRCKKKLSQQWKESIMVPIYKMGDVVISKESCVCQLHSQHSSAMVNIIY